MLRFLWMSFALVAQISARAEVKMVYTTTIDDKMQIALSDRFGRNTQQITYGPNLHLFPDISSDGRYVAYSGGPDAAHLGIEIKDLKTGIVEEYETPHGQSLHVTFSGDGRWFAYSSPRGEKSALILLDLETARAQGLYQEIKTERGPRLRYIGPTQTFQEENSSFFFPSLSSDGQFLTFQRSKDAYRKEVVKLDTYSGEKTLLSPLNGYVMAPSLSFDDRYVTYFTRIKDRGDIVVQDLIDHSVKRITNDSFVDGEPVFTPEGSVVYVSKRADSFALYEIAREDIIQHRFHSKLLIDSPQGDVFAAQFSGDLTVKQSFFPEIPAPSRSSFASVQHRDSIYIAGGHQGPEHTYPQSSFVDRFDAFDLKTKTWKTLSPRPIAAQGYMLSAHGKYLYAFGGFAFDPDHIPQWRSIDQIDRYDIENDRWETIGNMPRKRSSYVLGKLGSKVWIIGGWDATPKFSGDLDGHFHREIDVFDLEKETMEESEFTLPNPLRRAFSAAVFQDQIILIGGLGEGARHFDLLNHVTSFQPKTGVWQELPKLPFATFAPAAGILDNKLYVFGGMFKTGPFDYLYVKHIYHLPLLTDLPLPQWQHLGRYLKENKGFSMVVPTSATELGILGGHSYDGETDAPISTFEIFKP